jgi:hypothetical protein
MPFDPSRTPYTHSCGELPCRCKREHKPLEWAMIPCIEPTCEEDFFTQSRMMSHYSSSHSVPLPLKAQNIQVTNNGLQKD